MITPFAIEACMKRLNPSLAQWLNKAQQSPAAVLLTGESGTGKEVVALALHHDGPRSAAPFVTVNCAALPASTLESELFGHVRGARDGVDRDKDGAFVTANGGTVFLDDVGDLPSALQAKVLRALQTQEACPVGSMQHVKFDVRVIAATHRDLHAMMRQKSFRDDLYFRLKVLHYHIPALRHRQNEIEALALFYAEHYALQYGRDTPRLNDDVRAALTAYNWPGNIRELRNCMEHAVAIGDGQEVRLENLPQELVGTSRADTADLSVTPLAEVEREHILRALIATEYSREKTARLLGISPRTLQRRLNAYRPKS